jgi:hypothetical protein
MEARMTSEPILDRRRLVRSVVVHDQVYVEHRRHASIDGAQDCKNSLLRWRRWVWPITAPVAMSNAANSVVTTSLKLAEL